MKIKSLIANLNFIRWSKKISHQTDLSLVIFIYYKGSYFYYWHMNNPNINLWNWHQIIDRPSRSCNSSLKTSSNWFSFFLIYIGLGTVLDNLIAIISELWRNVWKKQPSHNLDCVCDGMTLQLPFIHTTKLFEVLWIESKSRFVIKLGSSRAQPWPYLFCFQILFLQIVLDYNFQLTK